MPNAFGAWGAGTLSPVTGTVTTPPSDPNGAAGNPTSGPALSYQGFPEAGGGGGGGSDDGSMLGNQGPNPEWGKGTGGPYLGGAGISGTGDPATFAGQGPGGFNASAGVAYFDDGGSVDDTTDDASVVDPTSMVQAALKYGRKSMGLPQSFYGSDGTDDSAAAQPAMFDGGVVPDQPDAGQQPGTGATLPDPRKTLSYLTGDGGVAPEIAQAMEQRADPSGQLSPAERVHAAISGAGSPQAAFSLLQHYRTKANAYSAGARAALDQGNLAQAAAHATQAMQNTPTGYDVRFAPTSGGVSMASRPVRGQQGQQPGFSDGGLSEDSDNPAVLMKQGYADGGPVSDPDNDGDAGGDADNDGDGPPLSKNIEDRRGEATPQDIKDSENAYQGMMENVRKAAQSYDDGGAVEDDENDQPQSVIPDDQDDQDQPSTPSTPYGGNKFGGNTFGGNTFGGQQYSQGAQSTPATQASPSSDQGQTTILTPDEFKQMLGNGYDWALEHAKEIGNSDTLKKLFQTSNPWPAQAQPAQTVNGPNPATGQPAQGNGTDTPWYRKGLPGLVTGTVEATGAVGKGINTAMQGAGQVGNDLISGQSNWMTGGLAGTPLGQTKTGQAVSGAVTNAAKALTTGSQSPDVQTALQDTQKTPQKQQPEPQPQPQPQPQQDQTQQGQPNGQLSREQFASRLNDYREAIMQADPNLRWGSRAGDVTKLAIQFMREEMQGNRQLANTKALGQNMFGRVQLQQNGLDARNLRTTDASIQRALITAGQRAKSAEELGLVRLYGQLAANPQADPAAISKQVMQQAQQMGIDPARVTDLFQGVPQPGQGQPQPQPQGQSEISPQLQQFLDVHQFDIVPNGPYAGMTYKQAVAKGLRPKGQ